jgi:hypothetical protein
LQAWEASSCCERRNPVGNPVNLNLENNLDLRPGKLGNLSRPGIQERQNNV